MATLEAQRAAAQAFRIEENLWTLQEARDRHNRRVLQVKRGSDVQLQSYVHREAFAFLNEAALAAAIMAAVAVLTRADRPRQTAISRRFR